MTPEPVTAQTVDIAVAGGTIEVDVTFTPDAPAIDPAAPAPVESDPTPAPAPADPTPQPVPAVPVLGMIVTGPFEWDGTAWQPTSDVGTYPVVGTIAPAPAEAAEPVTQTTVPAPVAPIVPDAPTPAPTVDSAPVQAAPSPADAGQVTPAPVDPAQPTGPTPYDWNAKPPLV